MPVRQGEDKEGHYYKYGEKGKRYYFNPKDKRSRDRAKHKAAQQGLAIRINKEKEKDDDSGNKY